MKRRKQSKGAASARKSPVLRALEGGSSAAQAPAGDGLNFRKIPEDLQNLVSAHRTLTSALGLLSVGALPRSHFAVVEQTIQELVPSVNQIAAQIKAHPQGALVLEAPPEQPPSPEAK